jgi:4,5:9,10-diseco-3-hydroxy-5,9,17-trioxoandrosta-1(10),2-diene-4-oate hydrolase
VQDPSRRGLDRPGGRFAKPKLDQVEAAAYRRYGLTPTHNRLRLAGMGYSTRAAEVGFGEPLLLLHGICLSAVHWAPVEARLDSARCIALDMPGHGYSEAVDFRGVDLRAWHSRMLTGCLDTLGLESAHVVGHSYGGMFGLWLALDAPERVRSVVCFGTPSVAFGASPDLTLRMLASPPIGPLSLTLPNPGFLYRRILAKSLGRPAVDAAPDDLHRATYLGTRRPGFPKTVFTYLREQFAGAGAAPQRYVLQDDELARIAVPVLIIWGENDTRYQSIATAKQRVAMSSSAQFVIVSGGHEPWLDDLDRSVQLLRRWLGPEPASVAPIA